LFDARNLRQQREKATEQTVKASKRKPITKPGTFNFRIISIKYNTEGERLHITGIPFRISKSGEIVMYETITFYIPVDYMENDTFNPFKDLCEALGLDSNSEISLSAFKNRIVEVDFDICDYIDDEAGEISRRFFNPERFATYQEEAQQ